MIAIVIETRLVTLIEPRGGGGGEGGGSGGEEEGVSRRKEREKGKVTIREGKVREREGEGKKGIGIYLWARIAAWTSGSFTNRVSLGSNIQMKGKGGEGGREGRRGRGRGGDLGAAMCSREAATFFTLITSSPAWPIEGMLTLGISFSVSEKILL